MHSAIKLRKKNNNKKPLRSKSITLTNINKNKERISAIEDTKKYYQVYYSNPNPIFLSQLKTETLNIFLSYYNLNDISVINKILKKYNYFETINLGPYDPKKKKEKTERIRNGKAREPITEGEKYKKDKEKRDKEIEILNIKNKIIVGIGKHLSLSKNIKNVSITNYEFDQNLALILSNGIINNNSIQQLNINHCEIKNVNDYEILLKGFLNHEKIEYLNLSYNNFDDKYGNIIGRIILRQTYRRDLAIWLCGLRNEKPLNNEYTLGLISINLNGNKLSSLSADFITTSLASDQYIRSITLANNSFDKNSCKKFIYMLRKNLTLLNIDLRNNPGYDENIKYRLILKMSKNIKHLYNQFQKDVYTLAEYEKYIKYIDKSLFESDIPDEFEKEFNENIDNNEEKIEFLEFSEHLNKINNINNDKNDNMDKNSSSKKKINSNEQYISQTSINSNPNNKLKNNTKYVNLSERKKNNIIIKNINNKTEDKNNKNNYLTKYKSLSIDKNYDKKLFEENLLLKRKLIEFKAKEIQNNLGKKINLPDNYDNIGNNFNEADELLDKLNNVMNSMKINKNSLKIENNKINNNNDEKKINYLNENKLEEENNNKREEESMNDNEDKFNNIDYSGII